VGLLFLFFFFFFFFDNKMFNELLREK